MTKYLSRSSAIIFCCFASNAAVALDIGNDAVGYADACRKITESEIIDGAIEWYVGHGIYHEKNKGKPGLAEFNPYPYTSISEFKKLNKNCCEVLDQIPGDFTAETQELGKEENGYKQLFSVRMKFLVNSRSGMRNIYRTVLVNCLGRRPAGVEY